MANLEYKIGVVTVTYGNRFGFLKQVVERVLESTYVHRVIVVDNASDYDVSAALKAIDDERITVLPQSENTGSAGGYYTAIEYFYSKTDCDFVFLLDDDNLPDKNVLDDLIKSWKEIRGENDKKALYCLRKDRPQHIKIAQGEDPYRYYLVPDNFLGFNILRIFRNQFLKLKDKILASSPNKDLKVARIPYVPYGGLFMHREMTKGIGYPNRDFYLYVDDSEYSFRITAQGGDIWLIPSCTIIDIDRSEGMVFKAKPLHSRFLDMWGFRVYYHVRNRMYFYSKVAVRNRALFDLNKGLYLLWLKVVSILTGKTAEYKKLLVAIEDGLKGKLGKVSSDKF